MIGVCSATSSVRSSCIASSYAAPAELVTIFEHPLDKGIAIRAWNDSVPVTPGVNRRRRLDTVHQRIRHFTFPLKKHASRAVADALPWREQIAMDVPPAFATLVRPLPDLPTIGLRWMDNFQPMMLRNGSDVWQWSRPKLNDRLRGVVAQFSPSNGQRRPITTLHNVELHQQKNHEPESHQSDHKQESPKAQQGLHQTPAGNLIPLQSATKLTGRHAASFSKSL